MNQETPSLFDLVVAEGKISEPFRQVREGKCFAPARLLLDQVFAEMGDHDGNFVDQFQTTGFDARIWELYLWAALREAGYTIDQSHDAPDFSLARDGLEWSVEATTSSRGAGGGQLRVSSEGELLAYLADELPIRLGSPLHSKLQKDYPGLAHVAGKPFVLALECFVSQDAFFFSESTVTSYLFGRDSVAEPQADGSVGLKTIRLEEHRVGDKVIPSGFFEQPDTELLSAVLFSNSGTVNKFNRLAFQEGMATHGIAMLREGFAAVKDPDVFEPEHFVYKVGEFSESWGHGLVVIHNPHAAHPLPFEALPEAVHYELEDEMIATTDATPMHVFMSRTVIIVGKGSDEKI